MPEEQGDSGYMKEATLNTSEWQPRFTYSKIIPFAMPAGTQFQVIRFDRDDSVKPHHHIITEEVYYVLDGEGVLYINGVTYALKKDSMFYIEPYDSHAIDAKQGLIIIIFKPIEASDDIYWEENENLH